MPLVTYVPDVARYEDVFGSQSGSGVMVRYRGSPYQNGSGFPLFLKNIFSKIGSFVRPLLRQAAPHARAAMNAAVPHLKDAATGAIKEAASQATQAIARKLSAQEGTGRRRGLTMKKKKTRRIPPFNIPDSF